ncbi:MAG: FHA domain-containing protein [Chthoniobacterales bacterium]
MPKLVIGGIVHELTDNVVTIGRAPDNTIVLYDPSVSGHHAQLELSGDNYRLKDLDSTNGTRVNGIPTTETLLRFDDRIRFGALEARYEPDVVGSQPLPQVEQIEVRAAESSMAPVDFRNASPFRSHEQAADPTRKIFFIIALIAFAAFLGSMVAMLMMRTPAL